MTATNKRSNLTSTQQTNDKKNFCSNSPNVSKPPTYVDVVYQSIDQSNFVVFFKVFLSKIGDLEINPNRQIDTQSFINIDHSTGGECNATRQKRVQ